MKAEKTFRKQNWIISNIDFIVILLKQEINRLHLYNYGHCATLRLKPGFLMCCHFLLLMDLQSVASNCWRLLADSVTDETLVPSPWFKMQPSSIHYHEECIENTWNDYFCPSNSQDKKKGWQQLNKNKRGKPNPNPEASCSVTSVTPSVTAYLWTVYTHTHTHTHTHTNT